MVTAKLDPTKPAFVTTKAKAGETCDRCGPAVTATHTTELMSGPLSWCGHHLARYFQIVKG